MAYISAEEVKEIRQNIKKAFPVKEGWKFSIRKRDCSMLKVVILQAPFDLLSPLLPEGSNSSYSSLNHYRFEDYYSNTEALFSIKKIINIANENNFDNSDSMTDYFNVGYYFSLSVGEFDKPFKQVA